MDEKERFSLISENSELSKEGQNQWGLSLFQLFNSLQQYNLDDFDSLTQDEIDQIQNIVEEAVVILYQSSSPRKYNFDDEHLIPSILCTIMHSFPVHHKITYILWCITRIICKLISSEKQLIPDFMENGILEIVNTYLRNNFVTIKRGMLNILKQMINYLNGFADQMIENGITTELIQFILSIIDSDSYQSNQFYLDITDVLFDVISFAQKESIDTIFPNYEEFIDSSASFAFISVSRTASFCSILIRLAIHDSNRLLTETNIFNILIEQLIQFSTKPPNDKIIGSICHSLSIILFNLSDEVNKESLLKDFPLNEFMDIIEKCQSSTSSLHTIISLAKFIAINLNESGISFFSQPNILMFFSDIYQSTYNLSKLEIIMFFWETGIRNSHRDFIDKYFPYLEMMFEIFESDDERATSFILTEIIPFLKKWIQTSQEQNEPLVEIGEALLNYEDVENEEIAENVEKLLKMISPEG